MKPTDFDFIKDFLYQKSGLVITPDKMYLLESRLNPLLKTHNLVSLDDMVLKLRTAPPANLVKDVVEAMTTNETSFFRDLKPFDLFEKTIMPYLLSARAPKKTIRIWCAACSSGQEPYSLAMILKEKFGAQIAGWKIDIVATDISDDILNQARAAIYTQFEVQRGLPITMLMKYFVQDGEKWKLKDDIKSMIRFSNFNLLNEMALLGTFDIIFCRNVLIYFDEKTKSKVLANLAGRMEKDAFLLLGGAETVLGITDKFKLVPDKRGLYIRTDAPDMGISTPVTATSAPPASAVKI
jgi:chemotaxis protein methyltransferase CheR